MSVLRRAKLRTPDGTESIEYPLGVEAKNVEVDNQENLSQRLVRIDEDLEKNEEDIAAVSELAGTNKQNIGANEIRIDALERRSVSIEQKPYYFNTVADMKAYQELKVGDCVQTLGYYSADDGGGAIYQIVNDTILVDDGGSVHDITNGLKAKLVVNGTANLKQYGAKGDGINDDTDFIQIAINNEHIIDGLNKNYKITSEITLKSNIRLKNISFSGNSNINCLVGDVLYDIFIENCSFNNFNYAISLSCYYSTFDKLKFNNCNRCFKMVNGTASGNLVENKYTNCDAQNIGSFIILPEGNKHTDAFILNNNINCNVSTLDAINIGSGAGHCISNIHIYGTPKNGIFINNAFNTNINNINIENYTDNAIRIGAQKSVNICNVFLDVVKDKNVLVLEKNNVTYSNDIIFNISDLIFNNKSGTPTNLIYSGTSPLTRLTNVSYDSNYRLNGFYTTNNLKINNYFITKTLNDFYIDYSKQIKTIKKLVFTGSEKTFSIPFTVVPYSQKSIKAKFLYTTYLNGTTLNKVESDILISRPNDTGVIITKTNSNMPISLSYDITNSSLSITYTPSDNTQYGELEVLI